MVDGQYIDSPNKHWRYTLNILPAGRPLNIYYGSKIGTVMFDGPVSIPTLYEGNSDNKFYRETPWMSLTPMEIITLRGGIRRAKGRVVVAGLGLGYQLTEIIRKKTVKEVVLIERDQSLVDWILPTIQRNFPSKPLQVIIGDVYKELPKLTADVAVVDVFKAYGNNDYEINDL